MSTLYLVRHGQGSLHAADYDALSTAGLAQARALGESWVRRGLELDALYLGPRKRHQQTVDALREVALEGGLELPAGQALEEVDEIRLDSVLSQAFTRVAPSCPDLKQQLARGKLDESGQLAMRHAMGIAAKLLERWARGETLDGVETFEAFNMRVVGALQQLMRRHGRGERVAIITSGGPIAAALRLSLDLAPVKMAALMTVVANGSVTQLRYTESQLTLDVFNAVGHLPDELVTRI